MNTLRDYVEWGMTHSDKTGSAEGVPLVMENCVKNKKMKQFEVYGNSIQNGTPSPEAPVEVESVGEFDADVGKYKVPVVVNGEIFTNVYLNEPLRRFGNYADVLDFKGQKVIRKIHEEILDGINTTKFNVAVFSVGTAKALRLSYKGTYAQYYLPTADGLQVSYYALCNMYPVVTSGKRGEHTVSGNTASMNTFDIIDSDYQTADEWDIHLQELASAGMPLKIIHALKNPIEETIECELPKLNAKTSIVEIDTSLLPSNLKGKYIKR